MDENRFWILASKKIACEISAEELAELELLYIHHPEFRDIIHTLEFKRADRTPLSSGQEEKILKNLRLKIAAVESLASMVSPQPIVSEGITGEISPKPFWTTFRKRIVLSSVIAVLGITLTTWVFTRRHFTQPAVSENNIVTKPGSKSQVKLPDGTLVILNADSKLSYPDNFVGDTREVTLEGEAFFEVTEDKSRPFIIHSKAMDIKVLGTVFNVKAYPSENTSEASLIKGSIEVTLKNRTNEKIMLKPNEKISVMTTAETKESKSSASQKKDLSKQHSTDFSPLISVDHLDIDENEQIIKEIGWTQNKLMFRNENLGSIAVILQRWYGRTIDIRSDKLSAQKFTGNFNNESLMQVIQALQVSYNFNYKNENNSIIIY